MLLPWEYVPGFLGEDEAADLMRGLIEETPWEQHRIKLFGKEVDCPRLSAWYGDESAVYTYSGRTLEPLRWTMRLLKLRDNLEEQLGESYNSVLLNYYRDGQDSMGCHSDDEPELGTDPAIASISLGAVRDFVFKSKAEPSIKHMIALEHGSLLHMFGTCQVEWQHSLPKRKRVVGPRVNLTFRNIV